MKHILRILALFTAVSVTSVAAEQARKSLEDFEKARWDELRSFSLFSREQNKVRDSKEFQDKLRAFFASLRDGESRMEAARLLYGRHGFLMNRELAAELVGPLIRDENPAVKLRAAHAVAYNNCGERYARELTAMLDGNPSEETVTMVVHAMGPVKEESLRKPIVAYLEKLMASPDPKVRHTGVGAMIRFSAPLARQTASGKPWPWLLPFLDDPDAFVRGTAVDSLPLFGVNGVELAMRMLDDTTPRVRERTLRTLEKLHDPKACGAPPAVQKPDAKDASFHGDDLCLLPQSLCAKCCDAIAKRLADPDPDVRGMATGVLGRLHAIQHVAGVVAILGDKEFLPRLRAVEALGSMGDPGQIEKLRPFLNDPDEQVRTSAAKSIALLTAKKAALPPGAFRTRFNQQIYETKILASQST